MLIMIYPDLFYYTKSISARLYSAKPSQYYDVYRLIQGHSKPWISLESNVIIQKKKFIISICPFKSEIKKFKDKLPGLIKKMISDGFDIYIWQYRKIYQLSLDNVQDLSSTKLIAASYHPFFEELMDEFTKGNAFSYDEVFILDNYWINHLFNLNTELPLRTILISDLFYFSPHEIHQLIDLQKKFFPPLSQIINDEFDACEDEKINYDTSVHDYNQYSMRMLLEDCAPDIKIEHHYKILHLNTDEEAIKLLSGEKIHSDYFEDKFASADLSQIDVLFLLELNEISAKFLTHLPALKFLHIHEFNLLFGQCVNLKNLVFLNIKRNISDFGLIDILEQAPNLDELSVYFIKTKTDITGLKPSSSSQLYSGLKKLTIHIDVEHLSSRFVEKICLELITILNRAENLEQINISNHTYHIGNYRDEDQRILFSLLKDYLTQSDSQYTTQFKASLTKVPKLKRIYLEHFNQITQMIYFTPFVKNKSHIFLACSEISRLTELSLNLERQTRLTVCMYRNIVETYRNLVETHRNRESLILFLERIQQIQNLEFLIRIQIDYSNIDVIEFPQLFRLTTRSFSVLAFMRTHQLIHLEIDSDIWFAEDLDEMLALPNVVANLQHIKYLAINENDDSDESIQIVSLIGHMPNLQQLNVNFLDFSVFSDRPKYSLESLHTISINYNSDDNWRIGDKSRYLEEIIAALEFCPNLRRINIGDRLNDSEGFNIYEFLTSPSSTEILRRYGVSIYCIGTEYLSKYPPDRLELKSIEKSSRGQFPQPEPVTFTLENYQEPPENKTKELSFDKKISCFSQKMIINRLCQFIKLFHHEHVERILGIQDGICLSLTRFFINIEMERWCQFLNALIAWNGDTGTIPKHLKQDLSELMDQVLKDYFNKTHADQVFYLGHYLKQFVKQNSQPMIFINPWHAIGIKPSPNPNIWWVYDPNHQSGHQCIEKDSLKSFLYSSLGHNISIQCIRPPSWHLSIANASQFISEGGIITLFKQPALIPIFAQKIDSIDFASDEVIDNLTLRNTQGIPIWFCYLRQNKVVDQFILKSLSAYFDIYEDAKVTLFNSLSKVKVEELNHKSEQLRELASQYYEFIDIIIQLEDIFKLKKVELTASLSLKNTAKLSETDLFDDILQTRTPSNRLIEFEDLESLQGFSYAFRTKVKLADYSMLCITEPAQIAIPNPHIHANKIEKRSRLIQGPGGDFFEFLEEAKIHPDKPYFILIHYHHFSAADIVKTNSILDKQRKIKDIFVPDNVIILGLINMKAKDAYQGQDFYSRMHQINKNPYSHSLLTSYIPNLRIELAQDEFDLEPGHIDLYHSSDWKESLLGRWKIQGQDLNFVEGVLPPILRSGISRIHIHQGHFNHPEFLAFWQELQFLKFLKLPYENIPLATEIVLINHQSYDLRRYQKPQLVQTHPFDKSYAYKYLNPGLFDTYLGKIEIIAEDFYQMPGEIEEKQNSSLLLYLTRDLSIDKWALFLDYCLKFNVSIQICMAQPSCIVELIPDLTIILSPYMIRSWSPLCEYAGVNIIESSDLDTTRAQIEKKFDNPLVLNISELDITDLLFKIRGELDQASLRFKFIKTQSILTHCDVNNFDAIILYGDWSFNLIDQLVEWLDTTELTVYIILNKSYPILNFPYFNHTVSVSEKIEQLSMAYPALPPDFHEESLSQLQARQQFLSMYPERSSDENWQGLEQISVNLDLDLPKFSISSAESDCKYFFEQRVAQFFQFLSQPYVFLSGLSGVGKSTFVLTTLQEMSVIQLHCGEDKLLAWAQATCLEDQRYIILFIDEANLLQRNWSEFEGLFHQYPGILLNGVYYPLTAAHKVVFAGNPTAFGDERHLATLFKRHGLAMMFSPLPPAIIYQKIIKPIWQSSILEKNELAFQQIISVYLFLCSCSSDNLLISPRELEMIALLSLNYVNIHGINAPDELIPIVKHYICLIIQPLVPKQYLQDFQTKFHSNLVRKDKLELANFVITPNRQFIVDFLDDLVKLHQSRKLTSNPDLVKGGLGGLILEGAPGIGKSELILEVLASAQELFATSASNCITIPASMSLSEKERLLYYAFDEGAIVIMDEMNSSVMMERLLNALLMGKTPEGRPAKKPGFFIFATQNPASELSGRQQISPALARRFIKISLANYSPEEILFIVKAYGLSDDFAQKIVFEYQAQVKILGKQGPSFRNIMPLILDLVKIKLELQTNILYLQLYTRPSSPDVGWEKRRISEYFNRWSNFLNQAKFLTLEIAKTMDEKFTLLSQNHDKKRKKIAGLSLTHAAAPIAEQDKPRKIIKTSTDFSLGFFASDLVPSTIPDGNCAYNAMVLFLRDCFIRLEGEHPFLNLAQSKIHGFAPDLNLNSIQLLKSYFLRTNPNDIQRILAPCLRQGIIDFIRQPVLGYRLILLERLNNLLCYCAENPLSFDIPDADTFLVHSFIRDKIIEFQLLALNEQLERAAIWWDSVGFEQYLSCIQVPARHSGDVAHWGGALELDAFGRLFKVKISITKNHVGAEVIGDLDGLNIGADFLFRDLHWSYLHMSPPIQAASFSVCRA